jgi:8-oxo-dGTP pyrophosphatase MutT (NUDIX family)
MIKIFLKDKLLTISEDVASENFITKISFSDKEHIKKTINNFLTEEEICSLNIYGAEEIEIIKEIETLFVKIRAAGGIVTSKNNELLFIKRLGVWDLPKGKIEAEETPKIAAIREVCEECGIHEHDLELNRTLEKTYHIYELKQKFILKETFWFEMLFMGSYLLTPQIEEDITEIKWINKKYVSEILANTYPSIELLINSYLSASPFPKY